MSTVTGKTIGEMTAEVDEFCRAKGWRENRISFSEAMALLHTEISEASDAWRRWGLADVTGIHSPEWIDGLPKPEGVGSEFADILIRLLDDCALFGADLGTALTGQHGAHGISVSFLENMNWLHILAVRASAAMESAGSAARQKGVAQEFSGILVFLRQLCDHYGISLQAEYERKMAYNRTRAYRHGGKRA